MGYKGIEKETQFGMIVDRIAGCENDKFTYDGVEFEDSSGILRQNAIEYFSEGLEEDYPTAVKSNTWKPMSFYSNGVNVSLRGLVDDVIDQDMWLGRKEPEYFSEADRREILQRSAKAIYERLQKYTTKYVLEYKVFDNGKVGFRYIRKRS